MKLRLESRIFALFVVVLFVLQSRVNSDTSGSFKPLSRIERQVNNHQECTITSEGSTQGSFFSPGYPEQYPSNSRCELDIEAPADHTISITFEDFNLGPRENCPNDWVSVTEYNVGQRGENVMMYCGSYETRRDVETASRNIKIIFQTDSYNNYKGFYAKYYFNPTAQTARNHNQANKNNQQNGNQQPVNNLNINGQNTQTNRGSYHQQQPQALRPNNQKVTNNPRPVHNQNKNTNINSGHQNKQGHNDKVQNSPGKPVSAGFPPKRCGKNSEDMAEDRNQQMSRIVGGSKTQRGEHPWQAMLWEPENKAFCGGAVLSDMWVLSAAHCFDPKLTSHINWKRVWIRLGKFNQQKKEEDEFNSQIENIYQHPDYNGTTFDSDLCLIKMKKAVRFSPTIQPICLGQEQFIERFFQQIDNLPQTSGRHEGPKGVVTGWGTLTEKGSAPKILQEIQIPIVSRSYCKGTDSKIVTKNMFCAGYDQDRVGDACQGDSGGPFMIEDQTTWYLIGVVSWGIGCGRAGQYGFYTKVNNFHQWIINIIQSES